MICLNIHTLIFHVAIWPVLPYVTRYIFTYIGLYTCVFFEFVETSQNGVCLAGKSFPHPVGVFCTHLDPPKSHIRQTLLFFNNYWFCFNIHTLIFHVAIWPALPYVTRYDFTYVGLYKCGLFLICLKPSNVHTNIFYASNPAILPYNVQNPSVVDLGGGSGFCCILFPI